MEQHGTSIATWQLLTPTDLLTPVLRATKGHQLRISWSSLSFVLFLLLLSQSVSLSVCDLCLSLCFFLSQLYSRQYSQRKEDTEQEISKATASLSSHSSISLFRSHVESWLILRKPQRAKRRAEICRAVLSLPLSSVKSVFCSPLFHLNLAACQLCTTIRHHGPTNAFQCYVLNSLTVSISCEDAQYGWVQRINCSLSCILPIPDLSHTDCLHSLSPAVTVPAYTKLNVYRQDNSCLGSMSAWLNKLKIKDVQDERMFVNEESPKVLCRQHCDICLFDLDLDQLYEDISIFSFFFCKWLYENF